MDASEVVKKVIDEELVSAARRNWIVTIGPIAGLRGPSPQVLIVQAICERTAKLSAYNKVARKAYVHRGFHMWKFYKVEELKNDDTGQNSGA